MAKVDGLAPPPTLEALFYALTSPNKVFTDDDGTLKLKKGKKKPKKPPKPNPDLAAFKRLGEIVATEYLAATGQGLPPNGVFELIQNMILGIYPPEYFRPCPLEERVTLISTPTCEPDPDPPPYGYRTPAFLPTICDYPDGVPDSGQPGSYGEKEAGYWHDRWLRWNRYRFNALAFSYPEKHERVAVLWDVTVSIEAASRGSRPMVSLNLKAEASPSGSGPAESTTPPLLKKTIFYWRFKVPPSAPPYYNASQVRRISIPMPRLLKKPIDPFGSRYVLNPSPRPMMGRGFNNNDTVNVSLTGEPKLFEVRKCMGQNLQTWHEANPIPNVQVVAIHRSDTQGRWVAVAPSGLLGAILRSTDAQSWEQRSTGIASGWRNVIYAQGFALWIAVAGDGSGARCITSPNTTTWTGRTMPIIRQWRALAYSPTLNMAVAGSIDTGTNNMARTSNGTTWTTVTTPTGWRIHDLQWIQEQLQFIGVGSDGVGAASYKSDDGVAWTKYAGPAGQGFASVAWSPSLSMFVALSSSNNLDRIWYSYDAETWNHFTVPGITSFGRVIWIQELGAFALTVQLHAIPAAGGGIYLVRGLDDHEFKPLGDYTQFFALAWSEETCKLVTSNVGPENERLWTSP